MDANIVLGSAILVLALASGAFLASIVLAASEEGQPRAGRPLYGRRTRGALAQPGTGPPAVSRAHCYYDCMSGFHWSSDWGGLCSEACSVSGRLPRG
jgi:hypothetical protein